MSGAARQDPPVVAVGDVVAGLGEGPVWDAATDTLIWVDIPNGTLHRSDPSTGRTVSRTLGAPLSLALPLPGDALLLARGDELLVLAADAADPRTWMEFPHRPNMRLNDGLWDHQGRLLIGTMVLPQQEGGPAGLWRVGHDGERRELVGGLRLCNGLAWSPDGTRLFQVDTPVRRIWVHEVGSDGEITGSRLLAEVEAGAGNPDGITVDAEGGVWVCLFGGWAVRRYSPEGRLLGEFRLPVEHPTSCAFGGDGLGTLFVTTASNRLDEQGRAAQPLAGRLLAVSPGVAGHSGVLGAPGGDLATLT